ncbi:MAG: cytochrome C [Chloroflexi bacterium]|nr:cytochrome C [Chloroflexota bacterium]
MKAIQIDPDVKVLLPDGSTRPLLTFLIPSAWLMAAAVLLMVSAVVPYWRMTLKAPQYPKGLKVDVYINHIQGDVTEIDGLNHYLGMPPLNDGGQFERSISLLAVVSLGLLLLATMFVHNQWAALLALPAIGFPLGFLADLFLILYNYGHSIDPKSALGGAIKPFTPPLIGEGKIGQFASLAEPQLGLLLAFLASALVLVGLYTHRAAYKPIVEARLRAKAQAVAVATEPGTANG